MRRILVLGLGLAVGLWGLAVEVLFFYDEGCPYCKEVWGFLNELQARGLAFTLKTYEVRKPENWQLLYRLLAVYGAEVGPVPLIFVGDVAIVHDTFYGLGPRPQKYVGLAHQLALEEVIRRAVAAGAPSPLSRLPPTATTAVLFLPPGETPEALFYAALGAQLVAEFPALSLQVLDPTTAEGRDRFEKVARLYGVRGEPPALFVGDLALLGGKLYLLRKDPLPYPSAEGERALREGIAKALAERAPSPLERLALREKLTLGAVVAGAALDSVNPCDLAVLVLLLGTLLVVGKRTKVLWAGLAFAAGVFVTYYLTGFVLYSLLGITVGARSFRAPFIYAVSSLAILVGLWEMKDLLWYGKWFSIEVPESWKPSVKRITAKAISIPGAFVVGLIDALFLAPCTSGPYLVILTLLSQTTTRLQGALWLLLYNFIFILPMVAVAVLVHLGLTTTARAERWRQARLGWLHFSTGLVMVLLGVGMIVGTSLGYL
ncbi:MAG: hypothetical protein N2507_00800 [Candidatus Bipolaricaulota bacterium]|nr:hypothetical protein [Candidatus Bipolaricaulota bacterium]